jgi:hypothetical protein
MQKLSDFGNFKKILSYDIGELYARYNRVYSVLLHEQFFVDSLNRAVLEGNWSIKIILKAFFGYFNCNVNYLAWPVPMGLPCSSYFHSISCMMELRRTPTTSK